MTDHSEDARLMSTYVVTGAASGMGLAVAERLRRDGHAVVTVDLRDADIIDDLSTVVGRRESPASWSARSCGAALG